MTCHSSRVRASLRTSGPDHSVYLSPEALATGSFPPFDPIHCAGKPTHPCLNPGSRRQPAPPRGKATVAAVGLHVALAGTLEEEPNDKDLQGAHEDNHDALDHAKVDDAALGAPDGRKVAVLAGAEVFLAPGNGGQLARQLEDALLQGARLLGGRALLGGDLGSLLVLDLGNRNVSRGPRGGWIGRWRG